MHLLLQELLSQVSSLHRAQGERSLLSGESFNVFRILGLETREVRTHSAFLAELLRPDGSHGFGAMFLELFLQTLNLTGFAAAGARVEVEEVIGPISADSSTGGRIDLCLYPEQGPAIFIENKIYAADQSKQLLRYHAHDKTARLLYLTLNGVAPSVESTGGAVPGQLLRPVSYATDIIAWLEACRKEAAMQPLVRETITQYLNLLRSLTGQSTDKRMTEEVKGLLLSSPEHLAAAQLLSNAFQELRAEVQRLTLQELNDALDRVPAALNFEDDKVLHYKGFNLELSQGFDSGGYYWGFVPRNQGGEGGNGRSNDLNEIAAFLREFDNRFKRNGWYVGWVNAAGFTRIESCSATQVQELATPAGRRELAARTAKQVSDCIVQLCERFGTTEDN